MSDLFGDDRPVPAERPPARDGVRCRRCGRKLAELALGTWWIRCPRCKTDNRSSDPD